MTTIVIDGKVALSIAKSLERIADVLEGSVQRWGNVDGICIVNANDILQDQIEDMRGLAELRRKYPEAME